MRLHRIFFWFLILLLPNQLGKHFWPDFSFVFGIRVDYLSPTVYLTDILVVMILGLWVIEKLKTKKKIFKTTKKDLKNTVFLFSIFCFLLVNVFLAPNKGVAFYKFVKILEFCLLGFYMINNNYTLDAIRYMLPIAVIYSSLIAIFQFLNQASLEGLFYWFGERSFNILTPGIALSEFLGRQFLRAYGTFSHPNSMAGFMMVSLTLMLIDKKQSIGREILKRVAFGLGLIASFFSFSRAVWLVGLLMCLWFIVYIFLKKQGNKFLSINYRFLIIFFALFSISFAFSLFIFRFIERESIWLRLQLIKTSWTMIKSAPLSGIGLNNFVVLLPAYWQSGPVRFLQPVHNIYLLVLTETGLVGLIIFLWFLFLTFRKVLKNNNWRLTVPLLVILLTGLFDHYWFNLQQNQLLATVVFGLAWSKIKL